MICTYSISVNRNVENFTQISPNGLISKSDNCTLFMNDLGVEITSMSDNSDTFYGIKVTPNGLFISDGASE